MPQSAPSLVFADFSIFGCTEYNQSDFAIDHLIAAAAAKSLQSFLTLCDPIDGSLPGSPVPGTLRARTLEWLLFPSPMHESEK